MTCNGTIQGVDIGKRIRGLRKTKGLEQGQLAEMAGMPQSTLSSIEHGDSKRPRGDHLARIASALNVSAEWLLGGVGSPARPIQPEMDESELLQIYHDLSEPHRSALMAAARALLQAQPKPTAASPLKRGVKQK